MLRPPGLLLALLWIFAALLAPASPATAQSDSGGAPPARDSRLSDLRTLNSDFPMKPVSSVEQWKQRRAEIRRRILVSQGLWPMPRQTPLKAVIHGRVERDDYTVDRVFFQSLPGHFVTGSLYRPKGRAEPLPAILSPHGHWPEGRFHDAGAAEARRQIAQGAEQLQSAARHPIQARAVQLARMGCLVFLYDMTGYADSVQLAHRPDDWSELDRKSDWGFMSVQADLRLQNMMGLQTWNSIRAVDFLLQLPETDPDRIGVTGASGGGTQSMILGAIDPRVDAAMPCVMVSTAMQGGCTCENAPLLRIDQGNIDIAAAVAPRPLGLTAADDWTVELETKGYPALKHLYEMLGHGDRLSAVFHTRFKHNYNAVNRRAMYAFFNRHFGLGVTEPITERDFRPLSRAEATVWTEEHPAPSGKQVGESHEVALLATMTGNAHQQFQDLIPGAPAEMPEYRRVVGGAWETILGRKLDEVGPVVLKTSGKDSHQHASYRLQTGQLENGQTGETVPVTLLMPRAATPPADSSREPGWVVWITDTGRRELLRDGKPIAAVHELVQAGYSVLAADLLGQGEGDAAAAQPMWYQGNGRQGWHRFSGYTYGYNHPLFVKRVHDVLTTLRYVRDEVRDAASSARSETGAPVHLVGLGKVAGPLVAAARTQAGDVVDQTWIATEGFRFESLSAHDHPMFVPGAVKYGDIEGLISLAAPHRIHVFGLRHSDLPARVYEASRAAGAIASVDAGAGAVDILLQRLTP